MSGKGEFLVGYKRGSLTVHEKGEGTTVSNCGVTKFRVRKRVEMKAFSLKREGEGRSCQGWNIR